MAGNTFYKKWLGKFVHDGTFTSNPAGKWPVYTHKQRPDYFIAHSSIVSSNYWSFHKKPSRDPGTNYFFLFLLGTDCPTSATAMYYYDSGTNKIVQEHGDWAITCYVCKKNELNLNSDPLVANIFCSVQGSPVRK